MGIMLDKFVKAMLITSTIGISTLFSGCNDDSNSSNTETITPPSTLTTDFDHANGQELSSRIKKLTYNTKWNLVNQIKLQFSGGHPQGIVRVGDYFYVSTVYITEPTVKFPEITDGYDRTAGAGIGSIIKFDMNGQKIKEIPVGEGDKYHPGGIDFDGKYIWVTAAEYRPNSASIVYRIDTSTDVATKLFEYDDHLGGISHDVDNNSLVTVSWGSRRFYHFSLDATMLNSKDSTVPAEQLRKPNNSFYIDYQDTKYLGNHEMLATGLNTYQVDSTSTETALGGINIIDLNTLNSIFQVPIKIWSPVTGRAMTNNPTWLEPTNTGGLRGYFLPDDDHDSTVYIYETNKLPDQACFAC